MEWTEGSVTTGDAALITHKKNPFNCTSLAIWRKMKYDKSKVQINSSCESEDLILLNDNLFDIRVFL